MKDRLEATDRAEIKIVGKSGQISLGKRYAGKTLRLDRRADGTLLLTAVAMVPESQIWTLEEPHRARIKKGLAWAAATPSQETNIENLVKKQPDKRDRGGRR